jgi:maltooligosyltrehalose trehalohydrolase
LSRDTLRVEVWAPRAKAVDLVADGQRVALRQQAELGAPRPNAADAPTESRGYWHADAERGLLERGYRFSIDGAEPIPDPRSRWQPQGVHGASYPVELPQPEAAGSLPRTALADAVIYEMHVGTFTEEGTYAAARAKLKHLIELGVTHVELMPLATFPGRRGWGYDGVDLYAPFPAYGTPQELAEFVRGCHQEGLSVLLDVVYNHLGPDGNYLGQFGPYFTDHYRTGWGSAINYDAEHSDEVRRFVIDNALMWLRDYGFDGLRLDAVHAIFSFGALHVLEELSAAVKRLGAELGRELILIAESELNDPRLVRAVQQGGLGLDAQWCDDFHHAIHAYFTGESAGYYADFRGLGPLAAALAHGFVYRGQYSPFRRRRHGREPKGVGADQLVVFSQNHDQIGNRAQGERLSMLLGLPQLKAIAAMTLLSPFVPLLFQGEEWGASTPFLYFTDHQDAELGRLVAEGRAREFSSFRWQGEVPNPQQFETLERSRLDWSEPERPPHRELLDWYCRLARLRHGRCTAAANATVKFSEQAGWLWFACGGLLVRFNLSAHAQRVPMPRGEWTLLLDSDAGPAAQQPGAAAIDPRLLPAGATRIHRRSA